MATGWTYEYVENEMTLPRLKEFVEYWRTSPPAHETLRIILKVLGVEENQAPASEEEGEEEGDLLGYLAGAGIEIDLKGLKKEKSLG
jgi:hypothetical protein